MTHKQVKEGNKLIAEFMGWYYDEKYDTWYSPKMMKETSFREGSLFLNFHVSWDWLMPVVDKIDFLGFETEIINNRCAIGTYMTAGEIIWHSEEESDKSKIEAVYKAVVDFIRQHNKKEYNNA